MPYWTNLEKEAGPFFRVLHETERSQTAFMTVPPGDEAGAPEVHENEDQVFYVARGEMLARVWVDGKTEEWRGGPGSVLVVEAGLKHWVKSVGETPLLFLTVYAPPAY